MPSEVESRLEIGVRQVPLVSSTFNADRHLGSYALTPKSKKVHADSYFDNDERLYSRGWSLRIRETSDHFGMTLKRPLGEEAGDLAVRDEIESPRDGSIEDTLVVIATIMSDAGVIASVPSDLRRRLMHGGAIEALQGLGLRRVFNVETEREIWIADDSSGQAVAEVALDKSTYQVATNIVIEEARIEIELIDKGRRVDLLEMKDVAVQRFEARDTRQSKYERGVILSRTASLREKMEAKVTLSSEEDYDSLSRQIDGSQTFIKGYYFNRASSGITIEDVYFDTRHHTLFEKGWYLRLRHEGRSQKLTFRRLTEEERQGQVLQNEIIVDAGRNDFGDAWRALWSWLPKGSTDAEPPTLESLDTVQAALQKVGLTPSLHISLSRTAWAVEKASALPTSGLAPLGERVAKLKYDKVTCHPPGETRSVTTREFEVTGVEQDDTSPAVLLNEAYQTFLASFVEACARNTSGNVDQRINAKYFNGLIALGLVKEPKWLQDGRLTLRVSARRELDTRTVPRATVWATVRFWAALTALIGGLFAVSSGGDQGLAIHHGSLMSHWVGIIQVIGFVGIVAASFYLFRRPYGEFPIRLRAAIVIGAVLVALAILLPWRGRSGLAEAISILGLVPLIIIMVRDGLGLDKDSTTSS